jgi:hypothetical protein
MSNQARRRVKSKKVSKPVRQEREAMLEQALANRLPQVSDQLMQSITLRYTTTGIGGSSSTTITFANLLDSWLIAGTATNGYQLFDFVRVKRVTVRAVSDNIVAAGVYPNSVSVGIEFPCLVAGAGAGGKTASDSAMGQNQAAMVTLRPDKMSAASFWQASSSSVAFVVRAVNQDGTVVQGAIVDVECSFKNAPDVNPAAVTSAIAGATAGAIYFGGLDGARLAATWARSVFIPRI